MAEERTQRRLAAILAADVVGYSQLIEQGEIDRDALERCIAAARAESLGRAKQIDSKLQNETRERVGLFACRCSQSRSP
jgi:hypothetical protein